MNFILTLPEQQIDQPGFSITQKLCACLIDQGHHIGGDPVGYKCIKPATEVIEVIFVADGDAIERDMLLEFDVCASCRQLIYENTGRTTFNTLSGRIKYDDPGI